MLDAPYEGWNRELEVELDSGPFRAHFPESAKSNSAEYYEFGTPSSTTPTSLGIITWNVIALV